VDEAADHDNGKNADGNVDVESVAPAPGVGEPAAQCGAKHRSDDDSESIGGHGFGTVLEGEAFKQDGLRERLQGAATCALQDAGQEDDRERRGRAAEERSDGEEGDADEQEALAAEAPGKPVGGGKDDRVGHQVAGQDPCSLGV